MSEEVVTIEIPHDKHIVLKFKQGSIFFSENGLFEVLKVFVSKGGTKLEDVGINLSKD